MLNPMSVRKAYLDAAFTVSQRGYIKCHQTTSKVYIRALFCMKLP